MPTVDVESLGTCPYCSGTIGYTKDIDGHADSVAHTMPMCSRYEAEDPITFIREVRRLREKEALQARKGH